MNDRSAARAAPPAWDADPREVLTALSSVVYQWDVASDRIDWGANAADVLGADMARLADGRGWRKLLSARSTGGRDEALSGVDETGSGVPFCARYEIVLPRGPVLAEDQGRWFAGAEGRPAVARGIVRLLGPGEARSAVAPDLGGDVRADLLRRIERGVAAARDHGRPFALLTGCVRDYHATDARHGSEQAELLVTEIMTRLREGVRQTDGLVRYGSNLFAVLLGRCPKNELEAAATRLSALACADPVEIEGGPVLPRLSWGGLSDLEGARGPRPILRRCEEAMHQAQERGLAFAAYVPDRRRESRRLSEQGLVAEVTRALNERRIVIARQPIVGAADRLPAFEEALVRLRREDGTILPAGAIVPVFESVGRIELLDHRVLELAIDALVAEPGACLSVNVSTPTLVGGAWFSTLSSAIVGRADIADRLIVELTESQAIEDVERTRKMFSKLKAMGLRTAIDDFGAGYTSFKHLRGLDVDILKIDGAFVQNIGRSSDDSFFVRTLIDLALHLGMTTVAEWVRDEDSARKLASWGATWLQGDVIAPATVRDGAARQASAASRAA